MPYYSWSGINIYGEIIRGRQFSRSTSDLDKDLFKNKIALLKAKESFLFKIYLLILKPKKSDINNIIDHISILLKAGLKIHQVLDIVSKNIKNRYLKIIFEDINRYLYEGQTLSLAFESHKSIFNLFTRSIVSIGEKSSNLKSTFEQLSFYNNTVKKFSEKLRSATLTSKITSILFLIIFFIIFIFIIPRFELFFNSIDKNLIPKSTKFVIYLSNLIRSLNLIYILPISLIFIYIFKSINLFLYIPIFSNFYFLIYKVKFLQKLNILLSSGINIKEALEIILNDTKYFEKTDIEEVLNNISSGKDLSFSFSQTKIFNNYELISLIKVGESSGDLRFSINQASEIYQNRLYKKLNNIIFLIQPLILVVLGSLITFLIFSIYIPIFTLSSIVK